MKGTVTSMSTLALCLAAVPAFAVNTAKVYKSGPLVLVFLGFFALLIVVQILPALSTLFGMIKGLFSHKSAPEEAVADSRTKQG